MEINNAPHLSGVMLERRHIDKLINRKIKNSNILYVNGQIGSGKTTAVILWLRKQKKNFFWISVDKHTNIIKEIEYLKNLKDKPYYLIIDNYQFIPRDKRKGLGKILEEHKLKVIIISRCKYKYSGLNIESIDIEQIVNEDFRLKDDEMFEFFKLKGILLEEKDFFNILKINSGWILGIEFIANAIKKHIKIEYDELVKYLLEQSCSYLNNHFLYSFDKREIKFLLEMSGFENFNILLSQIITGQADAENIIRKVFEQGILLFEESNDCYNFNKYIQKFLETKRDIYFSKDYIKNLYANAGRFYETYEDTEKALENYLKAEDFSSLVNVLSKISKNGIIETKLWLYRHYLHSIPIEYIKKDISLCIGMIMLNILCFNLDEVDRWYNYLKERYSSIDNNSQEKKLIKNKLLYLGIIISYQNNDQIFIESLKSFIAEIKSGNFKIHHIPFTVSRPSIINGGRDYSELILNKGSLKKYFIETAKNIYGESGEGIVEIGIAEWNYLCNNLEISLVGTVVSKAKIYNLNDISIYFAAMAVQIKILVSFGYLDSAKEILEIMDKRIRDDCSIQIIENYQALQTRLMLYEGNMDAVDDWYYNYSPDENFEFCILYIYRYFTKLRVYLVKAEYNKFISLYSILKDVCIAFNKKINYIVLEALVAVVYYRMGKTKTAFEHIKISIDMCAKYNYVRLLADEGDAIYQILIEYISKGKNIKHLEFIKKIMEESIKMYNLYPRYLVTTVENAPIISKSALNILKLMALGMSNKEIAQNLSISLNTVKFHSKNIYSKLGVNDRYKAVQKAKELNII